MLRNREIFWQGGLARASRRLARNKPVVEVVTRPTLPEANIKSTASLRDAFVFYSLPVVSLAKPRSTTG
jgi:hypothetical protein